MQEIVTKVLEAEKEAEQRLQEARAKAAEIRGQADREVQAKLQEAREQATRRSHEIVEQARQQAKEEYEQALQQAREDNREFFRDHDDQLDRAAEAVVELITVPQWT